MTGRGDGRPPRSPDVGETPDSTADPSAEVSQVFDEPRARARARIGSIIVQRFRLDELLGLGGSAAVYAATELATGASFAIKLLHPEISARSDLVRRFMREAAIADKLAHPAVVPVFENGTTDDGSVFLVMELLFGSTLDRWASFDERLSVSEALRAAEDVLDLLATAHEAGIIHRDIKPANIFRTEQGQVRVLDFGIARFFEGAAAGQGPQTAHGAGMGTPSYMPPEQARGRWNQVDGRTDVWAVGAVLFTLLSGEKPRIAETAHEELLLAMTEPVRSILDAAPKLPTAVADAVDRALSFAREDRFTSARAMQSALRAARESLEDASPASALTRPDLIIQEPSPPSGSLVFLGDASPLVGRRDNEVAPVVPDSERPGTPAPPPESEDSVTDGRWAEPTTLPRSESTGGFAVAEVEPLSHEADRDRAAFPGYPAASPSAVPIEFHSLSRSAVGFDRDQGFVAAVAEDEALTGVRLHHGALDDGEVLWRHPVPAGGLNLAAHGRLLIVAAGEALSTVDIVTGEVGVRTALPRVIDVDERMHNTPIAIPFALPTPVYVIQAEGHSLFSIDAASGAILRERTFSERVQVAPWEDVLMLLRGRTLELLDPVSLATIGAAGRAPLPEAESVVTATIDGPLLIITGEKRGLFGGGAYVSVVDGRTMSEVAALRERGIDPHVRACVSGRTVFSALRTSDGHGLISGPGGVSAGLPLANRRLVALLPIGRSIFTVLADPAGNLDLASVESATLAPHLAYGPLLEAPLLIAHRPPALGGAPSPASMVAHLDSRALVLAPNVAAPSGASLGDAPRTVEVRSFDTRPGSVGWSRPLLAPAFGASAVEAWGVVAGALVLRSRRALRVFAPDQGDVVSRL